MENISDRRLVCLLEYVLTLTEIKDDKVAKSMENEEYKDAMIDFLESSEHRMMFVIVSGAAIEVLLNPPKTFRGKMVFYMKKEPGSFPEDIELYDLQVALLIGDLSPPMFKTFTCFLGKVSIQVMKAVFIFVDFDISVETECGVSRVNSVLL